MKKRRTKKFVNEGLATMTKHELMHEYRRITEKMLEHEKEKGFNAVEEAYNDARWVLFNTYVDQIKKYLDIPF